MDIASALSPFIPEGTLSDAQLSQVSSYLDLLLKWNAKINLTSVRTPDEILTRHFGESFFLAHQLFGCHPKRSEGPLRSAIQSRASQPNEPVPGSPARPAFGRAGVEMSKSANEQILIDLGSGAGFPGLPLKIYASNLSVTLIESNQKKATFLREVIRTIKLTDINVFASRAEDYFVSDGPMNRWSDGPIVVTLRAVEHFDRILPLAAQILTQRIVIPSDAQTSSASARQPRDLGSAGPQSPKEPMTSGTPPRPGFGRGELRVSQSANEPMARSRLALLIGAQQAPATHRLLPHFSWDAPIPIPLSHSRILLLGYPIPQSS